jgi:hypothetical protein
MVGSKGMPWEDNDTYGAVNTTTIISLQGKPTAPSYELRSTITLSIFGMPSRDYPEFRLVSAGGEPSDCC